MRILSEEVEQMIPASLFELAMLLVTRLLLDAYSRIPSMLFEFAVLLDMRLVLEL
jgi:hypothetical protein